MQKAQSSPVLEKYYRMVTPESLERLVDFRQRYPYQTRAVHEQTWTYIDSDPSGKMTSTPVVILAGGTGIAEVSFQSIDHFAQQQRVIAPDYPAMSSLKELFIGLIALLDQLGVREFNLMGGSYGGWIVQSLVRVQPTRVHKVVMTAISPPNPENSRQLARLLPWLRLLPTFVFKAMLNRTFSRLDTTQTSAYPDMALLWGLVKEVLDTRVQRRDLFALMERLIDQTEQYTFQPDDLKDWPGSILMVFGSEDPASPAEKREAMRQLYPQAEMVVFEGGQHGIALTHQQEYFAAIDRFLNN